MIRLNGEDLRALGQAMLTAVGVADEEAELVADHLVESGLLGHDTHSVLRLPQYVNMVRDGVVDPGGQLLVLDNQSNRTEFVKLTQAESPCIHKAKPTRHLSS